MNREQIIRMAWEAGFAIVDKHILADNENGPEHVICTEAINRFAALVAAAKEAELMDRLTIAYMDGYEKGKDVGAAAEREACAAICDRFQARDVGMQPAECAGAIRARGQA